MAFSIFYLFPFILLCVLHSIWQLSMLVEPPLLQAETWSASISSIFQIRWRLASRNVDGLKPILDFFFGTLALSLADIDQEFGSMLPTTRLYSPFSRHRSTATAAPQWTSPSVHQPISQASAADGDLLVPGRFTKRHSLWLCRFFRTHRDGSDSPFCDTKWNPISDTPNLFT